MLQSDLCDYSDAFIVVKGTITVEGANNRNRENRSLAFKNNAPITNCISKINNVLIKNAEDLDAVIPNSIEYTKNYRKITGSLQNYYRDERNNPRVNPPVGNDPPTFNYNADPIANCTLFKYKGSIIGKTPDNDDDDNNTKEAETAVLLK